MHLTQPCPTRRRGAHAGVTALGTIVVSLVATQSLGLPTLLATRHALPHR